jgi:hypothetical protein
MADRRARRAGRVKVHKTRCPVIRTAVEEEAIDR